MPRTPQATPGFWNRTPLPHYVDFQSELELVRKWRGRGGGQHDAGGGGMRAATQLLNRWATPSPTLPRAGGGRSVAVVSHDG